jgi:hypothetical protein
MDTSSENIGNLIYEDRPSVDWWLKLLLGGIIGFVIIMGVVMLETGEEEGALVFLIIAIFYFFLFRMMIPRSINIYTDKLVIQLSGPFSIKIPYSNIKSVSKAGGSKVFSGGGIRLASSTAYVVEIIRNRGMQVNFSPSGGDFFMDQLNSAIRAYSSRGIKRSF